MDASIMLAAATSAPESGSGSGTGWWTWIIVLLVAAVLGGWLVVVTRRRILADDAPTDFTLQDLRALRDAGTISEAEFEAARAAYIGRTAGSAAAASTSRGGGESAALFRPDTTPPRADGDAGEENDSAGR